MSQESSIFQHLPQEITINILSRLPIKTIISCKLVCKPWLELLETREFADSHLSKSLPGLVVFKTTRHSTMLEFFELIDKPGLEHHKFHYNPVAEFDHDSFLRHSTCIQGSANGLLFLREVNVQPNVLHICNPITREFIELQSQEKFVYSYPTIVTYGFGVSNTTGQYKVVRVFHECTRDNNTNELLGIPKSECHVYTLGTRSWRKIAHDHAKLEYSCRSTGAFSNGNLHWLVGDLEGTCRISCFDLETELFHTFSIPCNIVRANGRRILGDLFVLSGRLCICDNTSEDEIVIWLMREYGDDESWTKEYVISKRPDFSGECYEVVRPMKVFGDGDFLMAWDDYFLFYYSERDKVARSIDMFQGFGSIDSFLHKPSLFSLTNFPMENAMSF
ncbi:F-box family protein [Striga asiatica]|uniref:F-box family protein n=1 Tax=Striga asiatica TaxID=4170 RepID=A0A5A7PZ18_STRAF|nr:F-box family protein [Striga asiatica]